MKLSRLLLLTVFILGWTCCVNGQTVIGPRTLVLRSGSLRLRALMWRPSGKGKSPAILFSPGSGTDPRFEVLGRLFAKRGYVFLGVFRRGQGLSAGQGEESARVWTRERQKNGDEAANRLQLRLLETEQLDDTVVGLDYLQSLPNVDANRIAVVGHSFGGSLAFLLAERNPSLRAAVVFGAAAASWPRSLYLRERLLAAVRNLSTPVFFVYAENDYSTTPGEVLAAELTLLSKPHRLKIFPAFGRTTNEGHNLIYLSVGTWEQDVFGFLEEQMK